MERFILSTAMNIPEYRLREWYRHFKRIAENARCDSSDTTTVNALRMARKDIRRIEKYLNEHDKT